MDTKRTAPEDQEQKAREYADSVPEEEAADEAYEPTYSDGSLKNECWNDHAWRDNG